MLLGEVEAVDEEGNHDKVDDDGGVAHHFLEYGGLFPDVRQVLANFANGLGLNSSLVNHVQSCSTEVRDIERFAEYLSSQKSRVTA